MGAYTPIPVGVIPLCPYPDHKKGYLGPTDVSVKSNIKFTFLKIDFYFKTKTPLKSRVFQKIFPYIFFIFKIKLSFISPRPYKKYLF